MYAVKRALSRSALRPYAVASSPLNSFYGAHSRRAFSSDFPRSQSADADKPESWVPPQTLPERAAFYTGRAQFYESLIALETAVKHTRHILTKLHLLPLPEFARAQLPPLQPVWRDKNSMGNALDVALNNSRYRRVLLILNQLDHYRNIAAVAGHNDFSEGIQSILSIFEVPDKEAYLARGKSKPIKIDDFGRAYAVGRRKESSARVWVIASRARQNVVKAALGSTEEPTGQKVEESENLLGGPSVLSPSYAFTSSSLAPEKSPTPAIEPEVTASEIIINNVPLARYFPQVADRERVVRPLKLSGLIGSFNVFALTRGGGHTGQSGSVSLGLAKCLAALVPSCRPTLASAKLLRRDPRMVERKKTGLAKARKRYAWVRR